MEIDWSCKDKSILNTKVIDVGEAKTYLEDYAREYHSSPIVVTIDGKPSFEMLPIRSDDPDFVERLVTNRELRELMEARRREAEHGRVSSLGSRRKQVDPSS